VIRLCDNSALSALAEINQLAILPNLFGTVVISQAVLEEARHPGAPSSLREFITNPPDWLTIVANPLELLPAARHLGMGEASLITLAFRDPAHKTLILDDLPARMIAQKSGLRIIGTLGILEEASLQGLLDFGSTLKQLQDTGFHLNSKLMESVRRRIDAR